MSPELNRLRVEQTDKNLAPFTALRGRSVPSGGWLKTIRESLGRPLRAQAERLGISAPTLLKSEVAEANDRITLGQLRKLAEGLDCELVYALVPREPLTTMVEKQAARIARRDVLGIAHSMDLEDQRPSDSFLQKQLADRQRVLLASSWTHLWR
jgi:predicted DNA-binding mobile mystery protein A